MYDSDYHKKYYQENKERKKKYRDGRKEEAAEYKKNYNAQNREKWNNYLISHGYHVCVSCGYNGAQRSMGVVEMHHTDPETKEFAIGHFIANYAFSIENAQYLSTELCKCIPLCANCHREIHMGLER